MEKHAEIEKEVHAQIEQAKADWLAEELPSEIEKAKLTWMAENARDGRPQELDQSLVRHCTCCPFQILSHRLIRL